MTLEEEIKKKQQIEIKAKEEWVKSQGELRKRIEIVDPIEEELKTEECKLEEKLRVLKEKEIELSKRESNYPKFVNNQSKGDNKSDLSIPAKIKVNAIGTEPAEQTKTIPTSLSLTFCSPNSTYDINVKYHPITL